MAIILPTGTVDAWQAAHAAGTTAAWIEVGDTMDRHLTTERDPVLRGDILTLVSLAGQHAFDLMHWPSHAGA